MTSTQIVVTSPPAGDPDGGGLVAPPTPRIQVQITYTPGPTETPAQVEHETLRLQREADHIVARG